MDYTTDIRLIANRLKELVDEHGYIDISRGTEKIFGVSLIKFRAAVSILKDVGYVSTNVLVGHIGTNQAVLVKVLAKPETTYRDAHHNRGNVKPVTV